MGLGTWFERVARRMGRDLDRQVSGARGEAMGTFEVVDDDTAVRLVADGAHARLSCVVRSPPDERGVTHERRESGVRRLVCELGRGEDVRRGAVEITADVHAADERDDRVAALVVEVSQPSPDAGAPPIAQQVHSVEARYDADGRCRLRLFIEIR